MPRKKEQEDTSFPQSAAEAHANDPFLSNTGRHLTKESYATGEPQFKGPIVIPGTINLEQSIAQIIAQPTDRERELFKTMTPEQIRDYAENYVREYAKRRNAKLI